jgi:putative membrane protein
MKKGIALPFAFMLLFALACNSENSNNKTAEQQNEKKFDDSHLEEDADFAMKAASGGLMEVDLGNYAAANAASPNVKAFGQTLAKDHQAANDELKSLAASKNITLPTVPDSDKQKKIDDLKKKTGADFDKDYVDMMVSDHKDDIDHFQKEADKGNDADIKTWAAGKIPTLQQHLQMAEGLQKELKK